MEASPPKVTAVAALPRSLASPTAAPERVDRGRKQIPVPDVTLGLPVTEVPFWYLNAAGK